jgi:hypothetical protein
MSTTTFMILVGASFALTACLGPAGGPGEEVVATTHQAIVEGNGLAPNGITQNGITQNGITQNGITQNGITQNGITQNGLLISSLTDDALTRRFFSYLVSCALPADQSVTLTLDGWPTTFAGSLGLAPGWGVEGGSCDTTCQEWVSACMLSRVNYQGLHVTLSERGNIPALRSTPEEQTAFPQREGAYWGNIFTTPKVMYACRERDARWTNLITRSCGVGIFDSIMIVRQYCDVVCDQEDATDGSYSNCEDLSGNPYPTVTVFRQ